MSSCIYFTAPEKLESTKASFRLICSAIRMPLATDQPDLPGHDAVRERHCSAAKGFCSHCGRHGVYALRIQLLTYSLKGNPLLSWETLDYALAPSGRNHRLPSVSNGGRAIRNFCFGGFSPIRGNAPLSCVLALDAGASQIVNCPKTLLKMMAQPSRARRVGGKL